MLPVVEHVEPTASVDRQPLTQRPSRVPWMITSAVALTLAIAVALALLFQPPQAWPLAARAPIWLLFLMVAAVPAWELLLVLTGHVVKRSPLPRIDVSRGITPQYATVVAVPVLLLDQDQVDGVIERLAHDADVVNDRDVMFALFTDFADSAIAEPSAEERALLDRCRAAIAKLNETHDPHGTRRFVLVHRERRFCATEQRWMGRERKRGKLDELFGYVVTGDHTFAETAGDVRRLRDMKYALVLDEDTQLTAGALQTLVAAAGHPMNQARVDPGRHAIVRGYGIFAPTVVERTGGARTGAARSSDFRDVMQDAIGQTGYGGKGLIDIRAYYAVMHATLPDECIVHYDMVEAALVRTAAVPDAMLTEPLPGDHETFCRRRHRWIRGTWQNALCLWRPGVIARMSPFGRWQVVHGTFNTCFPIAAIGALCVGAIVNPLGLAIVVPLVGAAAIVSLVARAVRAAREQGARAALIGLANLLLIPLAVVRAVVEVGHTAAVSADAILRTLVRVATGRSLLEWEPAAASTRWHRQGRPSRCRRLWATEAMVAAALTCATVLFTSHWMLWALLAAWTIRPVLRLVPRSARA